MIKKFCKIAIFILFMTIVGGGQSPRQAQANTLGMDAQGFSASPDQLDFTTIDSSRSLEWGAWSILGFVNYSKNNFLIYSPPITNQIRLQSKDSLTTADLGLAYGVTPHLQATMIMPWYLGSESDTTLPLKFNVGTGPSSLRLGLKYSLNGTKISNGFAFIGSVDIPNVRNDPFTGTNAQPIANLEAVFSLLKERYAFSANLGYRARNAGEVPSDAPMFPLKSQIFYSAGIGLALNQAGTLRATGELVGANPTVSTPYKNAAHISQLEALLSMKGPAGADKFWTLGLGKNALNDSISPDYRVFVGFNMYIYTRKPPSPETLLDTAKFNEGDYQPLAPFIEDADGDGVPDSKDECPRTPKGVKVDERGCPIDSDHDGVPDYLDKCPDTIPGEVVDRTGCPVIPDDDFDGVPNQQDRCPDTPAGTRVDRFGCPLTKALPKPIRILVLGDVLFDFDRATLKPEAVNKLVEQFESIKVLRPKGIIIEGYTDSVGKDQYNRVLSMRRAQTVKTFLVNKILLDPKIIRVVGFGKMAPIASNETDDGRTKNRRVEVKIFNQTLE